MSRTPSHEYRETLNAKSRDLEDGSRVINQYKITDLIGRGAYGAVRKAVLVDDPSVPFAVKEFGKTRLRKTHRAANFRKANRGRGVRQRAGVSRPNNSDPQPVRRQDLIKDEQDELRDPLILIRHEIAILKKLHHPHVVKLIEVLDDPSKDSLYMVFEYCPDGTIIDIRLHHQTEPLPEDVARFYFVQILMGIEYLHENEIVHRDIKPDNILLSDDRKTCKIVDFGVSEMFHKPGDDTMQKSAGSPAFMSPELCTAGHLEYHGKSDDIWSFGVTLYCMVVGRLPFDKDNFYQLYEAIKNEDPEYPGHLSDDLKDLLGKMLAKDPNQRITVPEIRQHPWTLAVEDGVLLSREDNLQTVVSEITDEDLDGAICKITNIFTFARAISRFKKGGSMQRARREASEASRSTSGSSNHDGSWFPPPTPSPDKSSQTDTKQSGAGDTNVTSTTKGTDAGTGTGADDVATVKKKSDDSASQHKSYSSEQNEDEVSKGGEEEIKELKKAAAHTFESPQVQTFELPPEEPDANGPFRRTPSGPVSTLHRLKPEQEGKGPPVIAMDSPRSASPDMLASTRNQAAGFPFAGSAKPREFDVHVYRSHGSSSNNTSSGSRSQGSSDYTEDTSKPDEAIASHLSEMMLKLDQQHQAFASLEGAEREGKAQGKAPQRKKEVLLQEHDHHESPPLSHQLRMLEERAASFGKHSPKPKPKLLNDQPTFASPRNETIQTPPGAADVYKHSGRSDDAPSQDAVGQGKEATAGDKEVNPYFTSQDGSPATKDGERETEAHV